MTRQHVILCEGYDDRAFWAGWLLHLGCEDPSQAGRVKVKDAWGETVGKGKFLFTTSQGSKILIDPFGGGGPRPAAATYIRSQATKPLGRLVINLDSDATKGTSGPDAKAVVDGIVRDHREALDGTEIVPIIWQCDDGESPGVPGQQTLERLVSAAIAEAYPGRGDAVASWLAGD